MKLTLSKDEATHLFIVISMTEKHCERCFGIKKKLKDLIEADMI